LKSPIKLGKQVILVKGRAILPLIDHVLDQEAIIDGKKNIYYKTFYFMQIIIGVIEHNIVNFIRKLVRI